MDQETSESVAEYQPPTMTFKSIGELLSSRRKELNISLKEAESATSIRENYLKSMEEGRWDNILTPIYAQGFFKQYASFLGIDGERIMKENPEMFNRAEPQEFAYGIGTLEQRGHPGAGVKWVPNALWITAFIISLLGAWYIARFFEVI
jgi:cytoskeletal protein RodZ